LLLNIKITLIDELRKNFETCARLMQMLVKHSVQVLHRNSHWFWFNVFDVRSFFFKYFQCFQVVQYRQILSLKLESGLSFYHMQVKINSTHAEESGTSWRDSRCPWTRPRSSPWSWTPCSFWASREQKSGGTFQQVCSEFFGSCSGRSWRCRACPCSNPWPARHAPGPWVLGPLCA